ncbi:MAG: c-type cytochrome biogenesis protein CcmI [Rhodocyclaceae bacterium]|nr:c-type cytochrome biogenesis protein CcmI [Rhodocyclaceae bacterium]
MTGFIIGAALLVGLTLIFVLWPFRRRNKKNEASAALSHRQLNAAIYRDQFAELERDRSEGILAQADYDQARAELQRRLLEDSQADATAPVAAAPAGRAMPIALALSLPLGAILLYLVLGSPAALNPAPHQQRLNPDDIEKMVGGFAAKLEKEPENYKGWAMLARSYKSMGRFPEAARAYERTGPMLETSADLLVDYADTLAAVGGGFTDKVNALIDKALRIDPANAQGLWMRGTASFEAGRYPAAIADWERLLALLEPGSEDAQVIAGNIAEAREKGGLGKAARKVGADKTAATSFVKGRVELTANLAGKIPAEAVVMVIARPADGSRMPAAVFQARAADLPLAFVLDDSLSMSPDRKLSQFAEIEIEARVSRSGQAMPQPGDLFGLPQTVKLGARDVLLKIDQVRQ